MVEEGLWTDCHSLRHTFRDRLRATGCPLELIDQIGGWSSIGTIGSKYGKGYDVDAVREQLNKVKFDYSDGRRPRCIYWNDGTRTSGC